MVVSAPRHEIVAGYSGVEVRPDFSCECGVIARIRRNRVISIGRVQLPAAQVSSTPEVIEKVGRTVRVEVRRGKRRKAVEL
jgi:hypothetical protein